MNNPWKAKRSLAEENGYRWWYIYCRNVDERGIDRGKKIICNMNLSTDDDVIPDMIQEILDAHNGTEPTHYEF